MKRKLVLILIALVLALLLMAAFPPGEKAPPDTQYPRVNLHQVAYPAPEPTATNEPEPEPEPAERTDCQGTWVQVGEWFVCQ